MNDDLETLARQKLADELQERKLEAMVSVIERMDMAQNEFKNQTDRCMEAREKIISATEISQLAHFPRRLQEGERSRF